MSPPDLQIYLIPPVALIFDFLIPDVDRSVPLKSDLLAIAKLLVQFWRLR